MSSLADSTSHILSHFTAGRIKGIPVHLHWERAFGDLFQVSPELCLWAFSLFWFRSVSFTVINWNHNSGNISESVNTLSELLSPKVALATLTQNQMIYITRYKRTRILKSRKRMWGGLVWQELCYDFHSPQV